MNVNRVHTYTQTYTAVYVRMKTKGTLTLADVLAFDGKFQGKYNQIIYENVLKTN